MTDSQTETWEQVKQWYYTKYGFAPELVEVAEVFDILKMFVSGSGSLSISKFLEVDIKAVSEVIDAYLGFFTWLTDLSFSPLKVYKGLLVKDLANFKDTIMISHENSPVETLENMYKACVIVEKLERLLDEKWI